MKYSGIGGQAVLEGIMMRGRDSYSIAVRKEDGTIRSKTEKTVRFSDRHKWAGWPFVRGFISLIESLKVGMGTLMWSADPDGEDTENGKALTKGEMTWMMVIAVILAIGIFIVLPMLISNLFQRLGLPEWAIKLIEGALRLLIFILYIMATTFMKEIRRTYQYHGAEHKCINCLETGHALTVENVMKSSREHRRCGTSFILIVLLISILIFILIPLPKVEILGYERLSRILTRLAGLGIRLALIPFVAAISYELQQFTGRHDNLFTKIISRPGMWLQRLTTREPDEKMCEVAITAVENVFDWKAFLRENYPDAEIPEEPADDEEPAAEEEPEEANGPEAVEEKE
ncbi:MAG: DUF1385 domain-containing protein [Lachnospiraceae bacterium]|nr:DUF1385 domain-containing protein [Lachnospiraceae bacterium]